LEAQLFKIVESLPISPAIIDTVPRISMFHQAERGYHMYCHRFHPVIGFFPIAACFIWTSCTSIQPVTKDKVARDQDEVRSVSLDDRTVVGFDSIGGRLRHYRNCLWGQRIDGEITAVQVDSIAEMWKRTAPPISAIRAGGQRIAEVVHVGGTVIRFDSAGASIDSAAGTLSGTTLRGNRITIDLSDAIELRPAPSVRVDDPRDSTISEVLLRHQTHPIRFTGPVRYLEEGSWFEGRSPDGRIHLIDAREVEGVKVKKVEQGRTVTLVVGAVALAVGITFIVMEIIRGFENGIGGI
jgi:hypothetical protein